MMIVLSRMDLCVPRNQAGFEGGRLFEQGSRGSGFQAGLAIVWNRLVGGPDEPCVVFDAESCS